MPTGLADQDIQPADRLADRVSDDIQLEFGVDSDEDALIDALSGKDVLFTTSRLPVTERVLESVSELDLVAKIGTGLDSIDLEAAAEHGVDVIYTPGINALSVAEHAVSLLLAVNRKVVTGQRMLESGGWRDEMTPSRPVAEQTVGIVGFGNIGSRVAGLLSGFNVELLAHDPYAHEIDTQITGADLVSLETLLADADAVIVTAELTEETRGLIDADALETMKQNATLVNTARGPIVDQDALVDALREGEIAGAGLDVFETEPLPPSSALHDMDSVVVTPHLGASTIRARRAVIDQLCETALKYFEGESLETRFTAVQDGRVLRGALPAAEQ